MKPLLRIVIPVLPFALAACSRNPSTLRDLAGPHALITSKLFWFFIAVNGLIWIAVLGILFISLWRNRVNVLAEPVELSAPTEQRLMVSVTAALLLTVAILTSYVIISYTVDHRLIHLDGHPKLEIEVTAHQWWWEIRYVGGTPSDTFVTANEIHVPVGEKVRLVLKSSDVIHSMWIPNLAGKRDIIPGHDEELVIRADRAGVWNGRCAEYCGMQHAMMGITLVSESQSAFATWQQAQRLPAAEPSGEEEKRGYDVFSKNACASCHIIRTAESSGYSNNAPDLTHLKSRSTIGAGAAPNTKGYLGGWILDPHGIKPGVHMPTILQESKDFQALLAYLETLK